MGLQQEVGRLVRRHRERMGLSQVDLADAIGRSVQMVGRIERGKSAPSFETLEEIARVLQTPVRDFFGVPDSGEGDPRMGRILSRLSALDSEGLAWVEDLLMVALRRRDAG